jgi:hypothetical protein
MVVIVILAIYSNYQPLLLYMHMAVRGRGQRPLGEILKGDPHAPFDA